MLGIIEFVRLYWLQLLQIIFSLIIGGNLAQQFGLQKQKSFAGRLARFTLALIFATFYYALFFYFSSILLR